MTPANIPTVPGVRAKGGGEVKPATNADVGFWANIILAHVAETKTMAAVYMASAIILLIVGLAERSASND